MSNEPVPYPTSKDKYGDCGCGCGGDCADAEKNKETKNE
jgi:hypothetical protein